MSNIEKVKQQLTKEYRKDERFEIYLYSDDDTHFSMSIRDWDIPKEYEDQIRQEDYVAKVMKNHSTRFRKAIDPVYSLIKSYRIDLGDKNYVDFNITLK